MFRARSKFFHAGNSAGAVALLLLAAHASVAAPPLPPSNTVTEEEADEPTTRPSKPSAAWAATLSAFADALANGNASSEAVEPVFTKFVAPDVAVREFNRTQRSSLVALRERTLGETLIVSRCYSITPSTLASDIAGDVRDATLPDLVKRRLTPADGADLKRANSVAAKWISTALMTSGNDPIGVMVFWQKDQAADEADAAEVAAAEAAKAAAEREKEKSTAAADETNPARSDDVNAEPAAPRPPRHVPLFVLVRGERVGNRYIIRQVCYGNPITLGGE